MSSLCAVPLARVEKDEKLTSNLVPTFRNENAALKTYTMHVKLSGMLLAALFLCVQLILNNLHSEYKTLLDSGIALKYFVVQFDFIRFTYAKHEDLFAQVLSLRPQCKCSNKKVLCVSAYCHLDSYFCIAI